MQLLKKVTQYEVWEHWFTTEQKKRYDTLGGGGLRREVEAWRSEIKSHLPSTVNWFEAVIEARDLEYLYIISSDDWRHISKKTFRATTVMHNLNVPYTDAESLNISTNIKNKIAYLTKGGHLDTQLIMVSCGIKGPWTILEGNHRSVALLYLKKLAGSRVYLGMNDGMHTCLCTRYTPRRPDFHAYPDHANQATNRANVHTFPLEKNLVAFREGENRLFLFNPTARLIWEYYSHGYDTEEISDQLLEKFPISRHTAQSDIHTALGTWRKQGLVRPVGGEPPANSRRDEDPMGAMDDTGQSYLKIDHIHPRLRYKLFGVSFEIGFHSTDLETLVHPLFAHLSSPDLATYAIDFIKNGEKFIVKTEKDIAGTDPSVHQAIGILIQEVINRVYAESAWMAVLHASAIRNDRHAIIFPAMGGSGKSTLTTALVSSGLGYLSDDVVPLESGNQHIRSVPLSICIKSGSWPALSPYYPELQEEPVYQRYYKQVKYLVPAGSYAEKADNGWPAACMVFPRYQPYGPTGFHGIDATTALQRIIDAGVWVSPDPEKVQTFLDWIQSVPCYDFCFHSLDEAVSVVREAIDS